MFPLLEKQMGLTTVQLGLLGSAFDGTRIGLANLPESS